MKNPHAVALGRKGGKIGGAVKSPAKSAAAQANGQKGGRPRKPVDSAEAAPCTARVKRPAMPTSNGNGPSAEQIIELYWLRRHRDQTASLLGDLDRRIGHVKERIERARAKQENT
jgi:hypothetical protein